MSWLAPGAEIEQLLDVPAAPTGAWKKLMHPETSHADAHGRHNELVFGQDAIAHYLGDDHVRLDLAVADRDSLFAKLAGLLEQRYDLAAEAVAAGLAAREALGSTAPGQGVAVPHGQIKGLAQPLALYVRPIRPIAFDAPDGAPVTDLVALFVPEWGEHDASAVIGRRDPALLRPALSRATARVPRPASCLQALRGMRSSGCRH